MDHNEAVRLSATEKYLLGELSPEVRDQFEEHFFECMECAEDVRAASAFVEQTKVVLTNGIEKAPVAIPAAAVSRPFSWFSPSFAVPAFALLLVVVGYQNFVLLPRMEQAVNNPQVLPWVTINTRTRGTTATKIAVKRGGSFLLFVNIPPDPRYAAYSADLINPAGKLEWSVPIQGNLAADTVPLRVPGAKLEAGTYSLVLRGSNASGENAEISRTPFDLQVEQ
jgi:hypothetical protein